MKLSEKKNPFVQKKTIIIAAVSIVFICIFLVGLISLNSLFRSSDLPSPSVSITVPEQVLPLDSLPQPAQEPPPSYTDTSLTPSAPTDSTTEQPESLPMELSDKTLDDVIFNTSDWVLINIDWTNRQRTVFERDRDSLVWIMQSRDGNIRMVKPSFAREGDAITIGFPTTKSTYCLTSDGSGQFQEECTWTFDSNPSYSKASISGTGFTEGLPHILSGNNLVIIEISWYDGSTMDFYRQNDGSWMVNERNGSFGTEKLETGEQSGDVLVRVPSGSNFVLHEDGTGEFENEGFNWKYSFTSYW